MIRSDVKRKEVGNRINLGDMMHERKQDEVFLEGRLYFLNPCPSILKGVQRLYFV